jgi:hypothetical protein
MSEIVVGQLLAHSSKTEKALELWKQFFEGNNDPWTYDDFGIYCFFCGKKQHWSNDHHTSDCIWAEAKKLVEEEHE